MKTPGSYKTRSSKGPFRAGTLSPQGFIQRQGLFCFIPFAGVVFITDRFLLGSHKECVLCLPAGEKEGWKYQPSWQIGIVSQRDWSLVQGSGSGLKDWRYSSLSSSGPDDHLSALKFCPQLHSSLKPQSMCCHLMK